MHRLTPLVLLPAIVLAACQKAPQKSGLDVADNGLANGAVTADAGNQAALRSAIHVDKAHAGGARGGEPVLAARGSAPNTCLERFGPTLAFDKAWAARLPGAMPVMPGATLTEAAGHDGEGCTIRIASFTAPGDRDALLGWYAGKAKTAGYSADRADRAGDHVLAGSKGTAAFYIIAGAPANGSTPVDYVWTQTG